MSNPVYVTMTDSFMSGWGMAEGKTNKYVVECATMEEAETIERNAKKRSEMKRVTICLNRPRYNARTHLVTWKKFEELGEVWKV